MSLVSFGHTLGKGRAAKKLCFGRSKVPPGCRAILLPLYLTSLVEVLQGQGVQGSKVGSGDELLVDIGAPKAAKLDFGVIQQTFSRVKCMGGPL